MKVVIQKEIDHRGNEQIECGPEDDGNSFMSTVFGEEYGDEEVGEYGLDQNVEFVENEAGDDIVINVEHRQYPRKEIQRDAAQNENR